MTIRLTPTGKVALNSGNAVSLTFGSGSSDGGGGGGGNGSTGLIATFNFKSGSVQIPANFPFELGLPVPKSVFNKGGNTSLAFTLTDGTALTAQYDNECSN